jgi:putative PIN family toxin of toxin-antitoxin system
MRLILDTNIVLEWLVFNDPSTAVLKTAMTSRRVSICTHPILIDELHRVLAYPALKLDADRQSSVFNDYRTQTTLAAVPEKLARDNLLLPAGFPQCRDRDDQPFIALAYHAKADALVTRDKAVLKLRKRAARFGVAIVDIGEASKLIVAWVFFRAHWERAFIIMLATMLVDLDHLLATPLYDPNRCSIGFHPLHTWSAIAVYFALLLPKSTRLIGLGLVIHMALDAVDCVVMRF